MLLVGEIYSVDQTQRLYHKGDLIFINTPQISDQNTVMEIADEINNICKNNNVSLFIANETNPTLIECNISVYYYDDSKQFLIDTTGVTPKMIKSIISGNVNISYNNIREIEYIDINTGFILLGDKTSVCKAYNEISDSYDVFGHMPADYDGYLQKRFLVLAAFSGIIVLILGAFQAVNTKRQAVIKEIMGYSPFEIILKKFFADALLIAAYYLTAFIILKKVSSVGECHKEIILIVISMLLADLIPYSMFICPDINSTIKGKSHKSKVLLFGYLINIPIVFLCIVSISAFFNLLNESMTFFKSEKIYSDSKAVLTNFDVDFFGNDILEARNNYKQYNEEIYRKYYDKAIMFSCIDIDGDFLSDIVYVNSNGKNMLFDMLPKIKGYSCDSDYTIFYGQNSTCTLESSLEFIASTDFNQENNASNDLFSYDRYELPFEYSVVGISKNTDSNFERVKNPVLIINNTCPVISNGDYSVNKGDLYNTVMYEFTDNDIKAIVSDYDFYSVTVTSVSEQFNYSWHHTKTELLLFGLFSCGILFFEISIMIFIIKNDFIINGVELCVYKLHGYSIFERFSIQLIISLGTIVAETLILLFLSHKYEIVNEKLSYKYIVLVGSVLLVFESIFIVYRSIKFENEKISNILKGGAI